MQAVIQDIKALFALGGGRCSDQRHRQIIGGVLGGFSQGFWDKLVIDCGMIRD
jgi:hypothetical protein